MWVRCDVEAINILGSIEIVVERTATLQDDLDAERAVVLNVPPMFVSVVNARFPANAGGNVRLIPRDLALGVNTFPTMVG